MTFIINPHSIVDDITNSSSELFVCQTDKGVDIVKKMLREIISVYNDHSNSHLQYNEVFEDPYIINEDNFSDMVENYRACRLGSIIIESKDDNSVPYAIMTWVEEVLNAVRYHG